MKELRKLLEKVTIIIDLLKIRKISIFALFPFLFLKTICIFLSTLHTNPTDLPSLVD